MSIYEEINRRGVWECACVLDRYDFGEFVRIAPSRNLVEKCEQNDELFIGRVHKQYDTPTDHILVSVERVLIIERTNV